MKEEIILKLEPLINKPIWYNNQETMITGYYLDDERERVFINFSNRGRLDRPFETAHILIEQFSIIPVEAAENRKPTITAFQIPGMQNVEMPFLGDTNVLDTVTSILMEDIHAIKDGRIELNKAEARANNIDKIIEIEKTKVAKAAIFAKMIGK